MADSVIDCSPMSEVSTASTTAHTEENHVDESPRGIAVMVVVGVLVGLLSGLFGIGGGTIIVPALVWLGLTQRHAAATSMLAIVPTSVSGVLAYAVEGNVDWIAALLMFLGMFIGGQIGSLLLSRLPEVVLRWAFVVFMAFIIASQLIFIPSRDSSIEFNLVTVLLMIVFGVLAGILAGLLGVGGGAICVPALSILFGASDLIARGTSLLSMFPNAMTTTVANVRRKMVHAKAGLIIGIVAALTAPLGTWIAGSMSPRAGGILFATYLTVLLIRSIWVALKVTRK